MAGRSFGQFPLQKFGVIVFEVGELRIKFLQVRIRCLFLHPPVEALCCQFCVQRNLQCFVCRTRGDARARDREQFSIVNLRNFDHLADIFFGHRAALGAVTIEIAFLEHRSMAAFFFAHLPKDLGDLQRIGIAKFRKQLRELLEDLRIPLFDEDGDVESFLGGQGFERALHRRVCRMIINIEFQFQYLSGNLITWLFHSLLTPLSVTSGPSCWMTRTLEV